MENRGRKGVESFFKEIMTLNFPNLGREWMSKFMTFIFNNQTQLKEIFPNTCYNKTGKSQRLRKNLKSNKREEACNLQENPQKAINRCLSRNLTCQERVRLSIQSAERKTAPSTLCSKVALEKNSMVRLSFSLDSHSPNTTVPPEATVIYPGVIVDIWDLTFFPWCTPGFISFAKTSHSLE